MLDLMQKEDLLKRIRLFATLSTVAFVVLIVVLLIQFGFITYYRSEIKQLQQDNVQMQKEIEDIRKDIEYVNGEYKDDSSIN